MLHLQTKLFLADTVTQRAASFWDQTDESVLDDDEVMEKSCLDPPFAVRPKLLSIHLLDLDQHH